MRFVAERAALLSVAVVILLLAACPANAVPMGYVQDFAPGQLTIATNSASAFRPGMTLYLFNQKEPLGTARVIRAYHSKVLASVTSGIRFPKRSLAILDPSQLDLALGDTTNRVSFADVGARGRGWIVQVSFHAAPGEAMTRKMEIPRLISVRLPNTDFYTSIDAMQVKGMDFFWDGGQYRGTRIALKNGQVLTADEIIVRSMNKITPTAAQKAMAQTVSVILISPKEQLQRTPDDVALNVAIIEPVRALGNGRAYLLKVYSNTVFVTEFLLGGTELPSSIQSSLSIPGSEMHPGANRLEFYIVEAELIADTYFEKGTATLIGERIILYGQNRESEEITISGSISLRVE